MSEDENQDRIRDIKRLQKIDQEFALLADTFPKTWGRLYRNCISEGFTELQAMDLIKTFIMAMSMGVK